MKLVVLGATGGTGMELVRESLKRGHSVTAFVRNAARLHEFQGRIRIEEGDPLDRGALAKVLENHDAVLSGLGRVFRSRNQTPTYWSNSPQCLPARCRMQACGG